MSNLTAMLKDRYGIESQSQADYLNDTIKGFLARRVCRNFLKRDIDQELLSLLLACAQSAPTKSNLQQYSIIVVRKKSIKKEIADLIPSMPWIDDAPVFLGFFGDVRRIRCLAKFKNHSYANNNADTFLNAAVDAALAMQMFINAAESAGLGCCPISYVRNRIEDYAAILKLPDGVFPIAGLALGWPAQNGYVSMRLPQETVIHHDHYDDSNLEKQIKSYDERNHDRFPLPPEKQRHTDTYGVLDKCTWSENVTRQLSFPERDGFGQWLKSRALDLT